MEGKSNYLIYQVVKIILFEKKKILEIGVWQKLGKLQIKRKKRKEAFFFKTPHTIHNPLGHLCGMHMHLYMNVNILLKSF